MKALLLKEYKQLEVTECPAPEIGADDVLVRVRAASAAATCLAMTGAAAAASRH